jgi:hypothetical protein
MKVGDLVEFKETTALATIIEASSDFGGYVKLVVHGGVLDATACASGVTYMSIQMLERTANILDKS